MTNRLLGRVALVLPLVLLLRVWPAFAGWTPTEWKDTSSLQFWTIDADRNEHWSTVWLVVIRGEVYLRLGASAADRLRSNTEFPYVKVRIRGQEFSPVRADIMPGMAAAVNDAMAEKYWSDLLIRYLPHPMTVRLVGPR